jgi:chaperonin cofactor prefoldin
MDNINMDILYTVDELLEILVVKINNLNDQNKINEKKYDQMKEELINQMKEQENKIIELEKQIFKLKTKNT